MSVAIGLFSAVVAVSGAIDAPAFSLTLSVKGEAADPRLEVFLLERLEQSWNVTIGSAGEAAGIRFSVEIVWLSARQLSVAVARQGELLTDRTIEVADPLDARLTLWLLLRSSIDRGLKRAAVPSPALAPSSGPQEEAALPTHELAVKPEVREVQPSGAATESRRAVGALVTIWLETPQLFAVGVSGTGAVRWGLIVVGASLGYRYTPGPRGLSVHGVPLSASLAVETDHQLIAASLGLLARGELKVPASKHERTAVFGFEVGPYGQARVPVDGDIGFVLRFAVGWRLVRQRYLFAGGRATEHPWATTLATGVDWR